MAQRIQAGISRMLMVIIVVIILIVAAGGVGYYVLSGSTTSQTSTTTTSALTSSTTSASSATSHSSTASTASTASTTSTSSESAGLCATGQPTLTLNIVSEPPASFVKNITTAFNEAYPCVHVSNTRETSGQILPILQEQNASHSISYDLAILSSPSPQNSYLFDNGYFASYNSPSYSSIPSKYIIGNNLGIVFGILPNFGVVYNKNLVPANMTPTSVLNLTQPFFKGQFSMLTPNFGGLTWFEYYYGIYVPYGLQAFKDLAANQPFIGTTSGTVFVTQVESGQQKAAIAGLALAMPALLKGAVGYSVLSEGGPLTTYQAGILAGATNVKAAQAFMDWLATPAALNLMISDHLAYSILDSSSSPAPGLPPLSQLNNAFILNDTQISDVNAQFAANSTLGLIDNAMGIPTG